MPVVRVRFQSDDPLKALRALFEHGVVLSYAEEDHADDEAALADVVVRSPGTAQRDLDIVALYNSDPVKYSSTRLGKMYGISRERVCQVLRRSNSIATAAERRRAARQALTTELQAICDRTKLDFQERMRRVLELVRKDKRSIKSAVEEVGFPGYSLGTVANAASKAARSAGIALTHGRHVVREERIARVRQVAQTAPSLNALIGTIRAEGDPINVAWIHSRMPEIARKYARKKRKR